MDHLLDYFENTVQNFPDRTAVACREDSYTFLQLRDLSRQLGMLIAEVQEKSGPGREADGIQHAALPVGVIVDRGIDTAVFFLAALYSGNFYVPIDPDMPPEKIGMILTDAEIRVLLCSEERKDVMRELGYEGMILTLNAAELTAFRDGENDAEGDETGPLTERTSSGFSPDTPAYMIYTSGSTGQPKGVLKNHGAVIDFMETFIDLFGLGPEEIIGNQTPFFFDASAKDFYQMVFTGATLEVLPSELFLFPVTLIGYMNQKNVSYICWVPSALTIVTQLNTFQEILPETLKKVFFVGETFPVKHLQKWMEALPDLTYVNLYGSTEIAGVCCCFALPVPFKGAEGIPVGRALPNCSVFLLEEQESPRPGEDPEAETAVSPRFVTEPGTVGEICVASKALALEYYHDPERTAKTFVTLTLPDGTQARVLKTGDLAKWDTDGNLLFVSRGDDQIKYMGHRIELGEIESVANRIPEIRGCCCLYDQKKSRICLFCELMPGCGWDGRDVRRSLKEKLSDYMQPSKCYIVDAIPLNANGKADREKLKEML